MAVRDDFSAGEVLAAADLNDTFASKIDTSHDHSGGSDGSNIPQSSVTGLVSDLASKIDTSHDHSGGSDGPNIPQSSVTGLTSDLNDKFDKSGGTMTGGLTLDTDNNTVVQIDSGDGNYSGVFFQTDGTNNWLFRTDGTPNTSTATGSNLKLDARNNNGTTRSTALEFVRDSQVIAAYWVRDTTTAVASNVHCVVGSGNLARSTSSIAYKTDVETLWDEYADKALDLRPVWYRSTASLDRSDWSHYGLIAEEVAEVDPRLVHFAEQEDGTLKPEGVQYDRIVPHLIKLVQRQQAQIDALTARLDAAGIA